jgi:hypothetical protein
VTRHFAPAAPRVQAPPLARPSADAPSPTAALDARRAPASPAQPLGAVEHAPSVMGGGAAPAGSGAPTFFAVLMSLLMLAAIRFSKLRFAPAAWRSVALVSSNERPG